MDMQARVHTAKQHYRHLASLNVSCTQCVFWYEMYELTLMAAVLTTMSLLWAMAMREKCWTTSPTTMWARESGMSMRTFLTWPRRPTSRLV